MLLLLAVLCVVLFEYAVLYRPKFVDSLQHYRIPGFTKARAAANALNEKWGLLYDSFRDELFNRYYTMHVDASAAVAIPADTIDETTTATTATKETETTTPDNDQQQRRTGARRRPQRSTSLLDLAFVEVNTTTTTTTTTPDTETPRAVDVVGAQ